jgi:hypothetical protein
MPYLSRRAALRRLRGESGGRLRAACWAVAAERLSFRAEGAGMGYPVCCLMPAGFFDGRADAGQGGTAGRTRRLYFGRGSSGSNNPLLATMQ